MSLGPTPLPGQQHCPNGHLCGASANYCKTCGAELAEEGSGR
ncbi:hypothetical protein [Natronorarus salvus]